MIWKEIFSCTNLRSSRFRSILIIMENVTDTEREVVSQQFTGSAHVGPIQSDQAQRFVIQRESGCRFLGCSNFFVIQSYEFRFGQLSALCLKTSNPRSFWKTRSQMDSRNYRKQQQENARENLKIHNIIMCRILEANYWVHLSI